MSKNLAKLIVAKNSKKKRTLSSSGKSKKGNKTAASFTKKGKVVLKRKVNDRKESTYEEIDYGKNSFMEFLFSKTKAFKEFKSMASFVTSILKMSSYPYFVVDKALNIQYMNPACLKFTGLNLNNIADNITCQTIFKSNICETRCAIKQAMKTGKPVIGKAVKVKDKQGGERKIIVNAGPLINAKGDILGGFEVWRDAMPDEEISTRVKKLLDTLDDYQKEVNNHLKTLDRRLKARGVHDAKITQLIDLIKIRAGVVNFSSKNIFKSSCWDVKNCPPELQVQCTAFPNNGKNCWEIDHTWCDGQMQGTSAEKISDCSSCTVYKNINGAF